jgi:iron complex transport system substrate-binding protein
MEKQTVFIILVSLFFLSSCHNVPAGEGVDGEADSSLAVKYAQGFAVSYFQDYKRVEVFDSWRKESLLAVYYLVEDDATITPNDGIRIRTPLHTVAITSCTQIEFLNFLGVLSTIKGAATPELIYNKTLQASFQKGRLLHLGDAFRINVENLLLLNPDALVVTSYNNRQDENNSRLQQAGIKQIYNNEWMEKSLLARAEWIKYMSVFYNREAVADSLFRVMETNYNKAKSIVATQTDRKNSILSGGNFKGTWYMPSGKMFMNALYLDAGGDYYYANDTTAGSLPLSFETVLLHQQHADVWLNAQANTLTELLAQDKRHALFDAVKNKRVYNFNARCEKEGANDFWEGAIVHPDVVLLDVIWALYPFLVPDYKPVYIKKLE